MQWSLLWTARDSEWLRAEHEAFERSDDRVRLADAVAGMVATTAPVAVGLAVGRPHVGLVVGLGGLNVALAMGAGRPRTRAPWGLLTMILGALATALATLVHPIAWLSVGLTFLVVGLASLGRIRGREGTLVGFVVSAVFVITNGLSGEATEALARGSEFLLGGALALALMMLAGLADPVRSAAVGNGGPPDVSAGRSDLRHSLELLRESMREAPEVVRHAVIIAATVASTTVLYRALGLEFGYWIPLTALAVLQPDSHASRVRLIQRASGTAVGVLVVLAIVATSASNPVLVVAIAVVSFGLFALRERSYHWLVTLLTPTALLMISTVGFDGDDIVVERIVDTAIGLSVALVVIGVTSRLHRRRSGGG